MKKINALIIIFFMLLIVCKEKKEQIFEQKISDTIKPNNQDVVDSTVEIEKNKNFDDIISIDSSIDSSTNFYIKRFSHIMDNEILAYLVDDSTIRIYAISIERKTHRLIVEFSYVRDWLANIQFSDDSKFCFLRVAYYQDYNFSPLYFIDGINGTVNNLCNVTTNFCVSNDGRYVADAFRNTTGGNRIDLYDVEKRMEIKIFEWNYDRLALIYRYGKNNFRVYNILEHDSADAEAEIDTYAQSLIMIREGGYFDANPGATNRRNRLNDEHRLNFHPRLMRDLNIAPPVKKLGFYMASENLQLFSEQSFSSEIITTIERGESTDILEIGNEIIIDGIKSNWVKVELYYHGEMDAWSSGFIGWCFGGYFVN